jgi:YrbI family 3-deoxy-D-manno-octulosonate 8-phosphate phosphatase
MIKLAILDIDGVLTDGRKVTDVDGKSISKQFNDKDFVAIKKLQASGVSVCFLSGDKNVNESVANKRSIDFYHAHTTGGYMSKKDFLPMLFEKYKVNVSTTLFIGDDYIDTEIMKALIHTYCPFDATLDVRRIAKKTLTRSGGTGVLSELYDELVIEGLVKECTFREFLEVDKSEKEKRK